MVSIVTSNLGFTHTVTERFLRYAAIDTQSDPASPTCPSTEKQKDLGRLLAGELQAMGIRDAHLDEHGYVYATIPANTDKQVPVICFCSHMDTSPDCTGKDVKPQIVKNYRGGDIMLPGDPTQIIRIADHPALFDQIGNDIVTSDGTTLLGADNKAGLAEIMDAARFLIDNPQIKHGAIKILFTPDEEIGRGVDKVDLKKLGADFAYTIDGETAGNIEDETFSADAATITIEGVSTHPGFAKGKTKWSTPSRSPPPSSIACRSKPAHRKPPRAGRDSCIRSPSQARWSKRRSNSLCAISPIRACRRRKPCWRASSKT